MTDTTTPSIRDSLEEVLETTVESQAQEQPQTAEVATQDEQVSEASAEGQQDLNELAEGQEEKASAQQRERDEQGKFKKTDGVQPGPKSGPQQPKVDRAPASWRPEVREHWAQLPEGVRAEVARRESEVARTLQESAEARKNYDAVMRTIQPYEAFIKAEGSNPLQAIDNLMSTAARLRTGTAPELAQMVAGIVQQFGVGRFGNNFIEMLDSALAGSPQARQSDPSMAVQQVVAQQLQPVQQFMSQFQQFQQQQAQRAQDEARGEVAQFLSNAEFGDDVRQEMADIMEVAARRGQQISLQEAYERAVLINPSTAKVMQQRQQAQSVMQRGGAAQRAKQAAVSVSGSAPVGALRQEGTDIRSAIEAAIAMNSR